MKTTFRWLLILSLGLALLGLLAGGALWQELMAQPGVSISINGEDLDIEGLHAMSGVGAVLGVLATGAVLCLVIPLVLLFSVGLPLLLTVLILGFVAVGLLSLGAMLFSPVIILGLLLWLVLRNKRPRSPRRANPPTPAHTR
ncbi:hypothetical protein LNV08_10200 [Paucibacter sp. TC2R-5]|uniref:hypothetical protein n=1 Tax=Paucibacter sp. TC2R-5 TaxID=2893555 RepID=UPI0021E42096|nr:hypothetical protein [Paucibacter sp. TC2R-5]MCV2359343.1 hypothetical protein [Paucibacter sp. TC2R-5]